MYHQMIAVTNRHLLNCPYPAPPDTKDACERYLKQIDRIAALGVQAIVLREKDLTDDQYERLASAVLPICHARHTELILHGFPETARRLGHKKIHLPLALLRNLKADGKPAAVPDVRYKDFDKIGTSVHSLEEALEAQRCGAQYLFAGNIYETGCKQGLPGRGLPFLHMLCTRCEIPVYAIGGVTPARMPEILTAGAAGGCMMSGFMLLQ